MPKQKTHKGAAKRFKVTGTGKVIKDGAGILTLNGVSTGFTGITEVAQGELQVGDINSLNAVLGGDVIVEFAGRGLKKISLKFTQLKNL